VDVFDQQKIGGFDWIYMGFTWDLHGFLWNLHGFLWNLWDLQWKLELIMLATLVYWFIITSKIIRVYARSIYC
jgi:hypothetical protein